ncbi:MAG: pyridoxal phosphate-dependent aminotransferase, partial [Muribaculaceae bacterium]|nr:pyridoxal phosphate-dependent aminotransferase [Muribaculaceae bacterium]
MKQPIAKEVLDGILSRMDIADVSKATIRQSVAVTNALEDVSGEKFVHLEIGVPGLRPSHIGVDAQKAALDRNVAAIYPNIAGEKPLKEAASRFIKAFIDTDIPAECVIPTVGSMQGCFNLLLECSQMNPEKPGVLFIDPGFPAQKSQAKVLGVPSESFDVYNYRAEKLGPKLEEYLSKGNIGAILYSNPNNPSWMCLTDDELRTIGEMANRYDVVVLEDFAYLCMDFRSDLSKPYQPPYQVSVSRYTDNYILMISASKIFSYAGERLGLVCFSP